LSFLVKELLPPGTDSGTKKLGKSSTCEFPGSWGHGGTPGATGQASNTVKQKAREINDLTVLLACLFYLGRSWRPRHGAAGDRGTKKGKAPQPPPIGEIFRVFCDF